MSPFYGFARPPVFLGAIVGRVVFCLQMQPQRMLKSREVLEPQWQHIRSGHGVYHCRPARIGTYNDGKGSPCLALHSGKPVAVIAACGGLVRPYTNHDDAPAILLRDHFNPFAFADAGGQHAPATQLEKHRQLRPKPVGRQPLEPPPVCLRGRICARFRGVLQNSAQPGSNNEQAAKAIYDRQQ